MSTEAAKIAVLQKECITPGAYVYKIIIRKKIIIFFLFKL
jgi:hypothetical protein